MNSATPDPMVRTRIILRIMEVAHQECDVAQRISGRDYDEVMEVGDQILTSHF